MITLLSTAPLAGAAHDALEAVATSDVNPALEGVWVDIHPYGVSFTGTDRTVLCRASVECHVETEITGAGLLSKEDTDSLLRVLEKQDQCRISYDESGMHVRTGRIHWHCELGEGDYPKWQALLSVPASGNAKAELSARSAAVLGASHGPQNWQLTFPDHGYPVLAQSINVEDGMSTSRIYVLAQTDTSRY